MSTSAAAGVASPWRGVVEEYRPWLDLPPEACAVSLSEGRTLLVRAPRLASWVGGGIDLYLKLESQNPTGSFKDRGMTAAVTVAVHEGAETLICASTGNTSASAAAYAARAGITCVVLVPEGKVALGKLAATLAYGARVIAIRGSFDDGLRLVQQISATSPVALVNSVNPARIQGQKTGAFEICDVLGRAPDVHALPVGNAGNITAYWLGYREYFEAGVVGSKPVMFGVQAEGAAPLVLGHPVEDPETVATAIRIGKPARGEEALAAARDSRGKIVSATDNEILEAYHAASTLEGVFCEPSSAASLAGLRKWATSSPGVLEGRTVVAVLTGHGLKDPDTAVQMATAPVVLDADLDALRREIL